MDDVECKCREMLIDYLHLYYSCHECRKARHSLERALQTMHHIFLERQMALLQRCAGKESTQHNLGRWQSEVADGQMP